MSDPRLERLRQLDWAATPGPWVLWDKLDAGYIVVGDTRSEPAAGVYTEADAEWIATVRRIIPATIDLLETLEPHREVNGQCVYCQPHNAPWPCLEAEARDAVLDQIRADDA